MCVTARHRERGTGLEDRRSALVQFEIRGDQDKADKKVQPVLDAVGRVQQRHPGFTVAEFGFASSTHELNNTLTRTSSGPSTPRSR